MKKKIIAIFALLFAVVLTGSSVSGTYAKYVSEVKGTSDEARVAKWSFKVNNEETTASKTFTFNLFDTIKDTGDAQEDDVKSGKIIAPGTEGSFKLSLKNESEVNANIKIDYTVTNNNEIPIEFSTDKKNWKDTLDALPEEEIAMESGTKDVTVYWRWTYDPSSGGDTRTSDTDETDTTLGQAGEAKVKVEAKITVTQKD